MKKHYTRKYIREALSYWKNQLRLAESLGHADDFEDFDPDQFEEYQREQDRRSGQFTPAKVQAALVARGFKKEDFRWVEPFVSERIADMNGEDGGFREFPEFEEFVDEVEGVLREKLSRRSVTRIRESRKARMERRHICEALRFWRGQLKALESSKR